MKTIKGEKITKKEIQRVLRSLDVTAIYRLHYQMFGNVCKWQVYQFIKDYAPAMYVRAKAYKIAYNEKNDIRRRIIDSDVIRMHGIYHGNDLIEAVDYVKKQCTLAGSSYAKRPMLGKTHLYFCSPIYGHDDYNKVRSIPIAGNEKFCYLLIKYADKYFAPIYGK